MASDPEPDKIFQTLPRILRFAINVEKDTLAGRINLITLLFVVVLTAALNAGPKLVDQVAQAIITFHNKEKELPEPPDFDYGLIWMWLLFMVVCMTFTSLTEKRAQAVPGPSAMEGNGQKPQSDDE